MRSRLAKPDPLPGWLVGIVGLLAGAWVEHVTDGWSNRVWLVAALALVTVVGLFWWKHVIGLLAAGFGLAGVVTILLNPLVRFPWEEPPPDDCGNPPSGDAVEVMVVWEDRELRDFCTVVAGYGPDVAVTSVGEDIGTALAEAFDDGDPPDVAIVPQPSLVRQHAARGHLCATPPEVTELFPTQWNDLVTVQARAGGQRQVYGAVVKGTHKSLFWYDLDALGSEDPADWTWGDLVHWVNSNIDSPTVAAPLSVPARSRWPLTDWFENQLAGTDPELYALLADGEPVDWSHPSIRRALTDMAELWRTSGVLAGGPEGAAATRWYHLPRQVFEGRAALAFGPSFVAGAAEELPPSHRLWVAAFPELAEGRPLIVGGDFAVVPDPSGACTDTTEATAFVEWLTGEEAVERWARQDRGFVTPNELSPYAGRQDVLRGNWEDVRVLLTALLRPGPDDRLLFDLSDDQFAVANGGDAQGSWNVLHRFFREVTSGDVDLNCALDDAIRGLEAEYRGEPPPDPTC
ncbi:MAG TPA: extracellular solute-binding protein [Acidimicrobiales bacterium]